MNLKQINRHLNQCDIMHRWALVTVTYTGMPDRLEGVVMSYAEAFKAAMYGQTRYMRKAPRVSRDYTIDFEVWKAQREKQKAYRDNFKYDIKFV